MAAGMDTKIEKFIFFVGTNLGHAVSNHIHNLIADELGLNWRLQPIDNPSLEEFAKRLHGQDFGGAIVTIPHKIKVMPLLDRVDKMGQLLGACNNVYRAADGSLTGTNTDWIGVRDSLLHLAQRSPDGAGAKKDAPPGLGQPAFVVGAGGASRAAVYTLHSVFKATTVYIINRDEDEVAELVRDASEGYINAGLAPPNLVHLRKPEDAAEVESAFYGVGTVPDFEAVTESEVDARAVFETLLSRQKGVFLDMCYRPRMTRNLGLARANGWVSGDGGQVVAWQLKAQWRLWAGSDVSEAIPVERMIGKVHEIVENLP